MPPPPPAAKISEDIPKGPDGEYTGCDGAFGYGFVIGGL
jgi:hypothetical protein